MPFLDVFPHCIAIFLFWARQMECFPSPGALLPQNRKGAKRVAAVERNGVIKNVEDTQAHEANAACLTSVSSTTCRKKASNISKVQSGAL